MQLCRPEQFTEDIAEPRRRVGPRLPQPLPLSRASARGLRAPRRGRRNRGRWPMRPARSAPSTLRGALGQPPGDAIGARQFLDDMRSAFYFDSITPKSRPPLSGPDRLPANADRAPAARDGQRSAKAEREKRLVEGLKVGLSMAEDRGARRDRRADSGAGVAPLAPPFAEGGSGEASIEDAAADGTPEIDASRRLASPPRAGRASRRTANRKRHRISLKTLETELEMAGPTSLTRV